MIMNAMMTYQTIGNASRYNIDDDYFNDEVGQGLPFWNWIHSGNY